MVGLVYIMISATTPYLGVLINASRCCVTCKTRKFPQQMVWETYPVLWTAACWLAAVALWVWALVRWSG